MNWIFGHLSRGSYDVIVIDPPWPFKHRSKKGHKKSAEGKYRTMPLDWIAALPVADLARRDCLLFCWSTSPLLARACDIVEGWGFKYSTFMSWRKTTVNGKVRMGPGMRVRSMQEPVIIAKIRSPRQAKALPGSFDGLAREHSRKPDRFYDLVADATPGALRCELFSRMGHLGFTAWGDEAGKFDEAA